YEYDRFGRLHCTTNYGLNGEPVVSKEDGCHGWEAEYDEKGNQTAMTYLGKDEKPMLIADGYATLRVTYDSRGKQIRMSCYGANGEPVLSKDGYHGWEAEYDEKGNKSVETYLG